MRASTALAIVLWIKIIVTTLFWSFPLLLLPMSQLKRLGVPLPEPALFTRLLGAAFSALVVGYIQGVRDLRRQKDITNTVWVGIVSNGLACGLLLSAGFAGTWRGWSFAARFYMWLSALLTGVITAGLITSGLLAGGAKAK